MVITRVERIILSTITVVVLFALDLRGDFISRASGNWSDKSTWATNGAGTISVTSGATAVSGSGSAFTTELVAGDMIMNSNGDLIGTVQSITSGTQLTLTAGALITMDGNFRFTKYPTATSAITIRTGHTVTTTSTVSLVFGSLTMQA